jgi:hypothetical protein
MLTIVDGAAPALDLSSELERGQIVYFPASPVELPLADDAEFLRTQLARGLKRKNVSWYPDAGKLVGLEAAPHQRERAAQILRQHSQRVQEFLSKTAIPRLAKGWKAGTCSFRPMQEKGRALSAHASNELVHVDAGAYGATHGDRILRFFVNLNPTEDRVWLSKGSFRELYEKHARTAGVAAPLQGDGALGRLYTGALRAGMRAFPMLRAVDSSAYDRAMRKFHNYMKDDPAFRDSTEGLQRFAFKPYSAWMVLTDTVSHACIEGQHAFVDTFIVPLRNCTDRESSPFHLLARGLPLSSPGLT